MPTPEHDRNLDILLHTLGLSHRYQKESYRNYYVSGPVAPELEALCAEGLMEERKRPGFLEAEDRVFVATEKGIAYAYRMRAKPSLAERRYHRFLSIADCYSELTFHQFLTHPDFEEARRNP